MSEVGSGFFCGDGPVLAELKEAEMEKRAVRGD